MGSKNLQQRGLVSQNQDNMRASSSNIQVYDVPNGTTLQQKDGFWFTENEHHAASNPSIFSVYDLTPMDNTSTKMTWFTRLTPFAVLHLNMSDEDSGCHADIGPWICFLCRTTAFIFIQTLGDLEKEHGYFAREELQLLKKAPHRPVKAIHILSQVIRSVDMGSEDRSSATVDMCCKDRQNMNEDLTYFKDMLGGSERILRSPIPVIRNVDMCSKDRQNMNRDLTHYEDMLGGSERILRSPIPVLYTHHTARFLLLWLTILPFSLLPTLGAWTTPVCVGVAMVLCAIEEIGVQCEEPFG
eukprot:gene16993-23268_t